MDTAREAAPEIDRLVLTVNGTMVRRHGDRLRELAGRCGLDSLELLPNFADFLLAGRLTRDLATVRMRYRSPEEVLSRLDEWEERRLIEGGNPSLAATPAFRPVLEALSAAQAEVAAGAWGDHEDDVALVTSLATEVADAASDDHEVAIVHRSLPQPTDPFLRLHTRLVTLRYIRQHDHAMAWMSRSLTAPDMVAMTALWHGEPVEESGDGLRRLVELGYAEDGPPRLTPGGLQVREEIEGETNRRAQETFDVLEGEAPSGLVAVLRRLPSAGG
ncbi:MAG: helix-turn-helix domain-containing protein [Actinomycetota bacterium]